MEVGLILIFLAGVAEFFKDLSEEGKLKGYWDKNHKPMIKMGFGWKIATIGDFYMRWGGRSLWWRVHWLQGGVWDDIPVWIRQYLAFRDGWHLLKFFSLNLFALGFVCLIKDVSFSLNGVEMESPRLWVFILIRVLFSTPETIGRIIYNKTNEKRNFI